MTDVLKELLRETGCFDLDDDFRQLEEVQSWYYIRRLLEAVREAYRIGFSDGRDYDECGDIEIIESIDRLRGE